MSLWVWVQILPSSRFGIFEVCDTINYSYIAEIFTSQVFLISLSKLEELLPPPPPPPRPNWMI